MGSDLKATESRSDSPENLVDALQIAVDLNLAESASCCVAKFTPVIGCKP